MNKPMLQSSDVEGTLAKPYPEGPYTLFMELGPKKTIPILVLGTSFHNGSVCGTLWVNSFFSGAVAVYKLKVSSAHTHALDKLIG